jgi:hypothetical protein
MPPSLGKQDEEDLQADVEAAKEIQQLEPPLRRSTRSTRNVSPVRFTNASLQSYTKARTLLAHLPSTLVYCFSTALYGHHLEEGPRTHKEAISKPNAEKWKSAKLTAIAELKKLKVFQLVTLSKGARVLPFRMVYSIKRNGLYKC